MNYRSGAIAALAITVIYVVILVVKDFLAFPGLYQDENHYLPTAILFSKEVIPSIELLRTYNQLNTPLPFIFGGWVVRIFGEDIQNLRLMNFILSFGLIMLLVCYKPVRETRRWLSLIPLLAMPSFYLCAIHYYTDMVAWLAVLLGVISYLKKQHLAGCVFFIAAISSRQYMLAFPLAIVLFEIVRLWDPQRGFKGFIERLRADRVWIYYSASILSLAFWVLLWGGLAPAQIMNEQQYGTAPVYNWGFVIYVSACIGFYFVIPETLIFGKWSYFAAYPKNYPVLFWGGLFLILMLVVFYPAKQTYNEYFTWPFLGYVDQLLETLGVSGWIKQGVFGGLMLLTLMRFIRPMSFTLDFSFVLINVLLLGRAQLSWDKYIFPTLLILWFLTMHHQKENKYLL